MKWKIDYYKTVLNDANEMHDVLATDEIEAQEAHLNGVALVLKKDTRPVAYYRHWERCVKI